MLDMSVFESLVYHVELCDFWKLPTLSLRLVFRICKMEKIVLLYGIVERINVVVYCSILSVLRKIPGIW